MSNIDPAVDDLSAVQADDRLLDLLGSATPYAAGELDDLSALMLAWRGEVDSVDPGDLVDLDAAVAAIAYAARSWWATDTGLKAVALALLLAVITAVALALTAIEL
ncbi:anti-sigma-D factor RsdA [Streptomyces sp. ID05-26A]|nr:anti-sigma-D factor RsdA [Streptomyces sp. ID05-26A]